MEFWADLGRVSAYFYTLDDDSERPMDYETSLVPKMFLYDDKHK